MGRLLRVELFSEIDMVDSNLYFMRLQGQNRLQVLQGPPRLGVE